MRRIEAFLFCDEKMTMLSSGNSLSGEGVTEEAGLGLETEFSAASKAL